MSRHESTVVCPAGKTPSKARRFPSSRGSTAHKAATLTLALPIPDPQPTSAQQLAMRQRPTATSVQVNSRARDPSLSETNPNQPPLPMQHRLVASSTSSHLVVRSCFIRRRRLAKRCTELYLSMQPCTKSRSTNIMKSWIYGDVTMTRTRNTIICRTTWRLKKTPWSRLLTLLARSRYHLNQAPVRRRSR